MKTAVFQNCIVADLFQGDVFNDIVWIQDCAPPHAAIFIQKCYNSPLMICRIFAFSLPLRTPDLTQMDFWFWSYLKSKVCSTNPRYISELKEQ